jgi:hypothetical protein
MCGLEGERRITGSNAGDYKNNSIEITKQARESGPASLFVKVRT